ncbi:hypothetical protein OQA88_5493 [Cercophora sp. LCS_1]
MNIHQMVTGTALDPLPQTIKDAIKVTRRLGIRYLWIDALCIIQEGDETDKLREVGLMGQVYKNATITLAAASARGVSEGFLHARTAPSTIPAPFYSGADKVGTVQVMRTWDASYDCMKPLNARGRTLQEALLSRRMQIYGERGQVWRCQTDQPKRCPGSPLACFADHATLPPEVFDPTQVFNPETATSTWNILVSSYTRRVLSFREDRLAAITGIISELKPLFDDECIFGTRRKNFVRQIA